MSWLDNLVKLLRLTPDEPPPKLTPKLALANGMKREPLSRGYFDLNPKVLRDAEEIAGSGDLRRPGELAGMVMSDDRIGGVLSTRATAVLGFPPMTLNADRTPVSTAAALALDEDRHTIIYESELGLILRWGVLLGVGLGQVTWAELNGRLVPRVSAWDPKYLRQDYLSGVWEVETLDGWEVVEPGGGRWILYTPYGYNKPWERGLWRGLSRWYLLKRYALLDWARYSERHGSGTWIATHEGAMASTFADRKELANDLSSLGSTRAISLPDGVDLKLVESFANTFETFTRQIQMADVAAAVATLGQNLTTQVEGGSFAAAVAHNEVRQDVAEFDEESLSMLLRRQLLPWWLAFNFPGETNLPWMRWDTAPISASKERAEVSKLRAEALEEFSRAVRTLRQSGVVFDVYDLASRYGIELVVDEARQV